MMENIKIRFKTEEYSSKYVEYAYLEYDNIKFEDKPILQIEGSKLYDKLKIKKFLAKDKKTILKHPTLNGIWITSRHILATDSVKLVKLKHGWNLSYESALNSFLINTEVVEILSTVLKNYDKEILFYTSKKIGKKESPIIKIETVDFEIIYRQHSKNGISIGGFENGSAQGNFIINSKDFLTKLKNLKLKKTEVVGLVIDKNSIKLQTRPKTIEYTDDEVIENEVIIEDVEYKAEYELVPETIWFNVGILTDVMSFAKNEKINVKYNTDINPLIVNIIDSEDEEKYIIFPIRIKE